MSSSNQRPANRGFGSVLRCAISHYRQSPSLSAPEPESDCGPAAKAPDAPPNPTGYAPPLDSTRIWSVPSSRIPEAFPLAFCLQANNKTIDVVIRWV